MWLFLLVLQLLHGLAGTMVKLSSGGFEGIVVAIDPELPEDQRIIESIKDMIREGSTYLFSATQQRFYFKSVKIIIPLTWTTKTDYEKLSTESYAKMDVTVGKTLQNYGDEPYTLQTGDCGEKGRYIHFTSNFLTDNKLLDLYGPRGRVFVHEWAHLRWGVFDEYNYDEPFYAKEANQVEATRCSIGITGRYIFLTDTRKTRPCKIDSQTGLYETGCLFVPEIKQNTSTSIMYMQSLPSVTKFCDKTSHNIQATNMQNKLCNYRSTWEVIMDSSDFASSKPMTAPPPAPIISLLKTADRVICLVLDVSEQMKLNNRINRVRQAAELFLVQVIEKDSWVGIVTFESTAKIVTGLQQIVNDSVRTSLANSLPTTAGGVTKICSGLHAGFQVFLSKSNSLKGCEIVLVTYGDDPTISSCAPEMEWSGLKIHTIALGPSAAKELSNMADVTGGLKFSTTDSLDSNGLTDAFSGLSLGSGSVFQRFFQLESQSQIINVSKALTGTVSIDKSVGNDTFFVVTWSTSIPTITLKEPKGKQYLQTNFVIDNTNRLARLKIAGTAMAGNWNYLIQNTHTSAQFLSMTITSRASSLNDPPVIAKTYLSRDTNPMIIFTEVTQGVLRVIDAKVIVTVEAGSGTVKEMELFDDGSGADIHKHDGVYSKYFISFKGNGPYSWKVRVQREGKTVRLFPSQSGYYVPGWIYPNGTIKMNPPRIAPNDTTQMGGFDRVLSGGSFIVTGVPDILPTEDLYPPFKVRDLRAYLVNNEEEVRLRWLAPGDDLDEGSVDHYELRMSENREDLTNHTFHRGTLVNTSSVKPVEAREEQMFQFKPAKKITKPIYFAIRGIDDAGWAGEVSNTALLTPPFYYFTSSTSSTSTTTTSSSTSTTSTSSSPTTSPITSSPTTTTSPSTTSSSTSTTTSPSTTPATSPSATTSSPTTTTSSSPTTTSSSTSTTTSPSTTPATSSTTTSPTTTTSSSPASTTVRYGTSHSTTGTTHSYMRSTHSTSSTIGSKKQDMTTLVAIIVGLSGIALCCIGGSILWFFCMQRNVRRSSDVLREATSAHTPTNRIAVSSV